MKYSLLFLALSYSVRALPCPDLVLPWGTYSGTTKENPDVCHYSNVRFASPPVGKLRFQAPEYPPKNSLPLAPDNVACPQIASVDCAPASPFADSGSANTSAPTASSSNEKCDIPSLKLTEQEDCLFLDIWAPAAAIQDNKASLPVVVWIYGGAYMFGAKAIADPNKVPLYNGQGFVNLNNQPLISIAGNYRLGAFGWLAGSYVEKNGQPNAGLMDQRALLTFVQDHISKIKGDPAKVSVWGESAGASSILHHVASPKNANAAKPLFRNVFMQSPAYQWLWDREGQLNNSYTAFAKTAGCANADMTCLQGLSYDALYKANQNLNERKACQGIMPVGPAVDGDYVPSLAPYSLWKSPTASLQSVLVSHTDGEIPIPGNLTAPGSFIPLPIRKDPYNTTTFDVFLEDFAYGDAFQSVRDQIRKKYPTIKGQSQVIRAQKMIQDSSFLCHTRFVIDRYQNSTPTYALNYAFGAIFKVATHASDLLPLFWREGISYVDLLKCKLWVAAGPVNRDLTQKVATPMRKYIASQAVNNDPGQGEIKTPWLKVNIKPCSDKDDGTCVYNTKRPRAVDPTPWSENSEDEQTSSSTCDFWRDMATQIDAISKGGMPLIS